MVPASQMCRFAAFPLNYFCDFNDILMSVLQTPQKKKIDWLMEKIMSRLKVYPSLHFIDTWSEMGHHYRNLPQIAPAIWAPVCSLFPWERSRSYMALWMTLAGLRPWSVLVSSCDLGLQAKCVWNVFSEKVGTFDDFLIPLGEACLWACVTIDLSVSKCVFSLLHLQRCPTLS